MRNTTDGSRQNRNRERMGRAETICVSGSNTLGPCVAACLASRSSRPSGQTFFSSRSFVLSGPVWSPGSRQLLFTVSVDENNVDLMLLDLVSGRTTTKLRKGYPIYGWAISPGNRQIEEHSGRVMSGPERRLAVENSH